MREQRHRFAHNELIEFQIEMLRAELAAFVIELRCGFKANLLQLIFLVFLCFHTNFENLAFILIKRLLSNCTIIRV